MENIRLMKKIHCCETFWMFFLRKWVSLITFTEVQLSTTLIRYSPLQVCLQTLKFWSQWCFAPAHGAVNILWLPRQLAFATTIQKHSWTCIHHLRKWWMQDTELYSFWSVMIYITSQLLHLWMICIIYIPGMYRLFIYLLYISQLREQNWANEANFNDSMAMSG